MFDSNQKDSKDHPDHISQKLLQVPIGHHYLVLYSDLGRLRRVYSGYVKSQYESQSDSLIVILPFYETTENVRDVLEFNNIDVKKYELENSLIIVDIISVIKNHYLEVPEVERLRSFIKEIGDRLPDKTIFVIADMSVMDLLKKPVELLEYERTLHKDLKVEKWKEICFYHKNDFNTMFSEEQRKELLEYHKDKVITI